MRAQSSYAYTPTVEEGELQCEVCGEVKDKDEFSTIPRYRESPTCRHCVVLLRKIRAFSAGDRARRHKNSERNFGLKPGAYDKMFLEQNGLCAICSSPPIGNKRINVPFLCIDHCHETTLVRGLLCSKCNTGLGQFEDNISKMEKAIEYIKKHRLAVFGNV